MPVDGRSAQREDWLVPLPVPREEILDATHFRSTWLTASQAALRERGLGEQYEAALNPAHRETLLEAVAGVWFPMGVARAHYAACDALGLTSQQMFEMGLAATRRANATTLDYFRRLAQGVGVTPWTMLAQVPRLWGRTCLGGAIAIARLGPKEARVEVVGYPLAGLTYSRTTFRGIAHAGIELFCQKVYVKEVRALCDERSLGFRLSWV